MMENSNALSDRNLEASTTLSLKREPACFAFLANDAVAAPMAIDSINLDLASLDYFGGRASLWATLEVRSGATNEQPMAVLGFDESFLRPFTRALIEAAASRHPYRMTIVQDTAESSRQRVVEYITGPGIALIELVLTPHDSVVVISGRTVDEGEEETLFQLPRSDSFLRSFVKMTSQADQMLRDTLADSEKLARRRAAELR